MIELTAPWVLLLLPAPLLVWRFLPPHREQIPALRFPFFRMITDAVGAHARTGALVLQRTRLEMTLGALVWVLVLLALARPEQIGLPIEIEKAARDVILAIDISGSMDEADFATTDGNKVQRLEAVKRVVGEFIEARQGDRVALIVFGTRAFLQSPFTEDLGTVNELLQQTEVGMAGPNTVIGDAIGLAIRTFEASDIEQRLLIVLSDGADTGSRMSPLNAAGIAAENGVEIHSIAVGDPSATGDKRVDEATLGAIAATGGGEFFYAGDERGLAEVYERIERLAPRKIETLSFRPRTSLAHWPLAVACILGFAGVSWLHFRSSGKQRG